MCDPKWLWALQAYTTAEMWMHLAAKTKEGAPATKDKNRFDSLHFSCAAEPKCLLLLFTGERCNHCRNLSTRIAFENACNRSMWGKRNIVGTVFRTQCNNVNHGAYISGRYAYYYLRASLLEFGEWIRSKSNDLVCSISHEQFWNCASSVVLSAGNGCTRCLCRE